MKRLPSQDTMPAIRPDEALDDTRRSIDPDKRRQLTSDYFKVASLVGDYLLEQLHSEGGFAAVYRARHIPSGRQVAVKVMHPELLASASVVRRFELEAQAVNSLSHPNIVKILEFGGTNHGRPYFVMEWLDGRNLDAEVRARGPLSLADALAVMEEVGAALAAAHERGVVHRDIKPSNIIALPKGAWFTCKLIDFGIAKLLAPSDDQSLQTSTGQRFGTPYYMAPEQIIGGTIDERTDIYALGVLLYYLLTGQHPYQADAVVEVQEMHLAQPPPSVSSLAPVSGAVDELVRRCLAKKSVDRFAHVADLLQALRDATASSAPAKEAAAVGVYIDARIDGEGDDDQAFDDRERAMQLVRAAVERARLTISIDMANCVLALIFPERDRGTLEQLRYALLKWCVATLAELTTRPDPHPSLRVTFYVHVGGAVARAGRDRASWSGPLIAVDDWLPRGCEDGVYASAGALGELESEFHCRAAGEGWSCIIGAW
jgi:eukaryotic-like serine/threonine-protein kinase